MNFFEFAQWLWGVRWWFVPAFAVLYLVPLARFAGFAFECGGKRFMRINRLSGLWEHLVFLPRDTIIALYLVSGMMWHVFCLLQFEIWESGAAAAAALLLLFAGWSQRSFRRQGHLRLAAFVRSWPHIHPQEFFDHMVCVSGAVRHCLPERPRRLVDSAHLDFKDGGRSRRLKLPDLARGAWSTLWLSRILIQASDARDSMWVRRLAGSLALVWAARTAQIMKAEVRVEGVQNLPEAGTPHIFLYTHSSFLDFAFASLVPAARPKPPRKRAPAVCAPSFLMAKDHFRDNPLLYSVLGIGKAAAALGMLFVERGDGASPTRARRTAWRAAEMLAERGMDLAVFPQGSRAAPCVGPELKRLDSAYYSVGSRERMKRDGAHLKRGASFIALESAMELAAANSESCVTLIPTAIMGSGIACPRGSMRILSNRCIRLVVGEAIRLSAGDVRGLKSPESDAPPDEAEGRYFERALQLHQRIDSALKSAARVHGVMERRFFEDIRDMVGAHELEEISLAMKPWRGDDFLFHAVLDAIYACDPSKWRRLLGEFVHLTLNFAPRDDLLRFKGRVVDQMPD